jgi:VanZ family protein
MPGPLKGAPLSRSTLATISKIALAAFWLGLFIATHLPPTTSLLPTQGSDKIAHALAYAALSLLLATTWELAVGRLNARHLVLAWLGATLFGAFDEVTQPLVGRYCNFSDWAADAIGAAIGLLLFFCLRQLLHATFPSGD